MRPTLVGLLGVLVLLVLLLGLLWVLPALGAEPSPPSAGVLESGDPRSEGAGPGLIGSPLLILAGVVALGVATAVVTLMAARLRGRD